MSRTRRAYNRDTWRKRHAFWHPYKQVCMGHCHFCKQATIDEIGARNREMHRWLRSEIRNGITEAKEEQTDEQDAVQLLRRDQAGQEAVL